MWDASVAMIAENGKRCEGQREDPRKGKHTQKQSVCMIPTDTDFSYPGLVKNTILQQHGSNVSYHSIPNVSDQLNHKFGY